MEKEFLLVDLFGNMNSSDINSLIEKIKEILIKEKIL